MVTIYPTLVIGLGGTGKAILWDVRARMLARFGSFRRMPMIGYLALDTDEAMDKDLVGIGSLGESLRFNAAEHLHLSLTESQVRDIKTNLAISYHHLNSWLAPESLTLPVVHKGAGAIRQIGRMALFQHYSRVKKSLSAALARVADASAQKETRDFLQEAGVEDPQFGQILKVFVVGSLIGGTGCGTFLDVGYMFRRPDVVANIKHMVLETTGVFVLPVGTEGGAGVDTSHGTYAALTELHHFGDSSTRYEITEPETGHTFQSAQVPFDWPYLVTIQNRRASLGTGRSLVEMVGQKIYLDATNSMMAMARSQGDNVLPYMQERDKLGCHQYFVTFGVSTLEVPVRAIASSCGARFLAESFNDLRFGRYAGKEQELKIDPAYLGNFLQQHALSEEKIRQAMLGNVEAGIRESFMACAELSSKAVVGQLMKLEKDLDQDTKPSAGEGVAHGRHVLAVEANARHETERCELQLTRLITDLAHRPEYRLLYVKKFLEMLKQHFTELKQSYLARAEHLEKKEKMGRMAVQRGRGELAEIAGDWLLAMSPWQKGAYRDAFEQRYGRDVQAWVRLRLEAILSRPSVLLGYLDHLLDCLDSLRQRVGKLDEWLADTVSLFEGVARESRDAYMPVNGRVVYAIGSKDQSPGEVVDQAYSQALGNEGSRRQKMETFFADQILPLMRDPQGQPNIFLLQKEALEAGEMNARLWRLASNQITDWGKLDKTPVIDGFLADPAHVSSLKEVAGLSESFLLLNKSDVNYTNDQGKQQTMVAFHGASRPSPGAQQTFQGLCKTEVEGVALAREPEKHLFALDEPAQVIFYEEYGGFPIRLWEHLGLFRKKFDAHRKNSLIPAFLMGKSFKPLFPDDNIDDFVVRMMAGLYLAASLDGMEILGQNKAGHHLDYKDGRGVRHILNLQGDLWEVGRTLGRLENKHFVEKLEKEVLRRRMDMGDRVFAGLLIERMNQFLDEVNDPVDRDKRQQVIRDYMTRVGLDEISLEEPTAPAARGGARRPAPPIEIQPETDFPLRQASPPASAAQPPHGNGGVQLTDGGAASEGAVAAPPVAAAEKVCPECAETVKAAAKKCRFCQHVFE